MKQAEAPAPKKKVKLEKPKQTKQVKDVKEAPLKEQKIE